MIKTFRCLACALKAVQVHLLLEFHFPELSSLAGSRDLSLSAALSLPT